MSTPLPRYVQLEPVGQCNLRCRMCPIQFRRDGPPYGPPAFMGFDLFVRLLDGFAGLTELHLQGLGEPMMHPRFFDMVALAVSRGVRVTTNSNLTLLNERRARACVTSGLATLHVSIDGARPETYDAIRVRGHFDRVVANVRLVLDARRRLESASPRLHMVAVAMRENVAELPELVHLAADLEMDELFVQHLAHDFTEESLPAVYAPMRRFVEQQTLLGDDPARVAEAFADARVAAEARGLRLRLPPLAWRDHDPVTPGRQRCDWPWRGAYVSYDGRAMPCCMVATPDRANFGSMATHGVRPIWEGEPYDAFRQQLDGGTPPVVCAACSLYRGVF